MSSLARFNLACSGNTIIKATMLAAGTLHAGSVGINPPTDVTSWYSLHCLYAGHAVRSQRYGPVPALWSPVAGAKLWFSIAGSLACAWWLQEYLIVRCGTITSMFASSTFLFCSVLSVQGLIAQLLPRSYCLRLSTFLQVAAFCLFLSVFFLNRQSSRKRISLILTTNEFSLVTVLLVLSAIQSTERHDDSSL